MEDIIYERWRRFGPSQNGVTTTLLVTSCMILDCAHCKVGWKWLQLVRRDHVYDLSLFHPY
jgi:hypothetical protein